MAGKSIVTGNKELDAKLATMNESLQKKFARSSLRKNASVYERVVVNIIRMEAYDTGALSKSIKRRANKRSRIQVGIAIMPPRSVVFSNYAKAQQRERKKLKNATFAPPKTFYYPASIEFGTAHQPAVKPFRRGLYEPAATYRRNFHKDMVEFVNSYGVAATNTT